MRPLIAVLVLLVASALAPRAEAQLYPFREHVRQLDSGRLALGGDVAGFGGAVRDDTRVLVHPSLLAAVRWREIVVEAALPLVVYHESIPDQGKRTRVAIGNPYAGVAYLPDCGCGLSRLSLGVAAPTAPAGEVPARALATARAVEGDGDGYLYRAHLFPLVAGASTRMERGQWLLLWDGDLVFGLPGGARDFDFGTQHAVEADLRFGWDISIAARASLAYYPTLPGDDFQGALTTFLRYAWVDNTLAVRFVMNVDPPGGFSFSRGGIWGAGLHYVHSIF
jgi:hypothetical protein